MKRNTFIFLICAMAILCSILSLRLESIVESILYYVLYFPINILVDGLCTLSLSGDFGNVVALLLYVLISMSPLVVLCYLFKNKKQSKEDIFLFLLSITLFVGIYFAINPSHFSTPMFVGGIIYSIVICYSTLKILRSMKTANNQKIMKYLYVGLVIILVYLLFTTFYKLLVEYQFEILQLQHDNYDFLGEYANLDVTCITFFIKHVIDSLPYFMCSIILYHILNFIHLYQKDSYSEEAFNKIIEIRNFSIKSLKVIVLSSLGNCIFQFLLVSYIYKVSIQVEIPIIPIVGVLGITFISKIFADTISLKRDNEMFI